MKLTDTDFLQFLKRDLGPEIAAAREANRIAAAKELAKERAAALADLEREFPELEKVEEKKLKAFHELSKTLEHARQEAHAAHVARVSLQRDVGQRVDEINAKIFGASKSALARACVKTGPDRRRCAQDRVGAR